MKIGKPISNSETPSSYKGKYAEIWDAVRKLKADDWLPVTFDDKGQAFDLANSARGNRTLGVRAKVRGLTVYLQKSGKPRK